jgi:antitoxin (DNA-binding transcriptional repressor) of toxin-antitoxin stability system
MQYGLAQAKARLSELTSLVDAGEEVVIAKHGRPSYKLILVSGAQADGSQTAAANQTPTGLGEMSRFVAQTRARAENFVAEWRQSARY